MYPHEKGDYSHVSPIYVKEQVKKISEGFYIDALWRIGSHAGICRLDYAGRLSQGEAQLIIRWLVEEGYIRATIVKAVV